MYETNQHSILSRLTVHADLCSLPTCIVCTSYGMSCLSPKARQKEGSFQSSILSKQWLMWNAVDCRLPRIAFGYNIKNFLYHFQSHTISRPFLFAFGLENDIPCSAMLWKEKQNCKKKTALHYQFSKVCYMLASASLILWHSSIYNRLTRFSSAFCLGGHQTLTSIVEKLAKLWLQLWHVFTWTHWRM